MQEVIQAAKAVLNEPCQPPFEWIVVLVVVQWALNMTYRQRVVIPASDVMLGQAPRTKFAMLAEEDSEGMQLEHVEEARLRRVIARVTGNPLLKSECLYPGSAGGKTMRTPQVAWHVDLSLARHQRPLRSFAHRSQYPEYRDWGDM